MLACLRPYTVNFKWACLDFTITKIELMYSASRWAKPGGLFLECSVGYLELRRLKLKYTWQLTLCLLHIIGSTNQVSITLTVIEVRAMHKWHFIVWNSAHDYSLKLSSCICSHTDSSCPGWLMWYLDIYFLAQLWVPEPYDFHIRNTMGFHHGHPLICKLALCDDL